MSLMEEPIAARDAYFVFLYILVIVPEDSCWLLVKPAHFFSALNASTTTISMTSLLTHTVAHSTRPFLRSKTNYQPLKKW